MSTICETNNTGLILKKEIFEQHLAHYKDLPWLQDLKKKYWEEANSLDLPAKNDERWRFASIGRIKLEDCTIGGSAEGADTEALKVKSSLFADPAAKLVFANDVCIENVGLSDELKSKGVIFEPLSDAYRNHPDLVQKYLFSEAKTLGAEKFFALQAAYCSNGAFLYVPKNVVIEQPIAVYNWTTEENTAAFPHTLIAAEDNSAVTLVDYYGSSNGSASAILGYSSLNAGDNAKVSRVAIQNMNDKSQAYQVENVSAGRDARTSSVSINLGCHYSRLETRLDIKGAGAESDVHALTVAVNKQEFDQRTLQTHSAPNAVSNLLYKNALLNDSRTIFSGMIKVDECAQQTDAYQTNRNLLLSDRAASNSLPGLEILANDVKCSHGATTSRLSEDEIFYMKARGIPERTAQKLLVFGFFEEILEKLENEELAESVRNIAHEKFDSAESE